MKNLQVIHGDCMEMLPTLAETPTLIVTDPPYLIPRVTGGGTVNSGRGPRGSNKPLRDSAKALRSDGFDVTAGYDIKAFAKLVNDLQKGNINAYFFCNKVQIPEYLHAYVTELKCKFDLLCWHKSNIPPTYSNKYLPDTEYILFFHKGKGHTFPNSYEMAKTWWTQPMNVADKKAFKHPTIKPMNIVMTLVENSSEEGELVLDPFCGSGTTGCACKELDRHFIGIELNAEYASIARNRILAHQANRLWKSLRTLR